MVIVQLWNRKQFEEVLRCSIPFVRYFMNSLLFFGELLL